MSPGKPSAARKLAKADASGASVVLFDRARVPEASPELFNPDYWRERARPVVDGGRGAAWFIDAPAGGWVLRHYQRGGLIARLSKDRYLWAGESAVRSVAEFHLLQRLHGLGLPVPAAVAAYYARRAGVYRAAIIVARLPDVRPLASLLDGRAEPGLWPALGRTLARFHAAGVDHADLNANNILIDSRGQIFLIDFDRGAIRNKLGAWRARNLARLQRSLAKLGGATMAAPWRAGWARAMAEYHAALASS